MVGNGIELVRVDSVEHFKGRKYKFTDRDEIPFEGEGDAISMIIDMASPSPLKGKVSTLDLDESESV